jgi:hypothetical protein
LREILLPDAHRYARIACGQAYAGSDLERTIALFTEALTETSGDRRLEATLLCDLGDLVSIERSVAHSEPYLESAVIAAERVDEPALLACAIASLATRRFLRAAFVVNADVANRSDQRRIPGAADALAILRSEVVMSALLGSFLKSTRPDDAWEASEDDPAASRRRLGRVWLRERRDGQFELVEIDDGRGHFAVPLQVEVDPRRLRLESRFRLLVERLRHQQVFRQRD